MSIIMIAMTDINNGIANKRGNLLFKLPKDMAHFKNTTSGHKVVMGRKTFNSLKNKPLKNRENIVLTRDTDFKADGVTVVNDINTILDMSKNESIYIIGGGEIYKQFMPHADTLIMTHVHHMHKDSTVFFPEISAREWRLAKVEQNQADKKHKYSFTFATYKRVPRELLELFGRHTK